MRSTVSGRLLSRDASPHPSRPISLMTDERDPIDPLEQAKLDYAESAVDFRYWQARDRQQRTDYTAGRLRDASDRLFRASDRLKLALAGVYEDPDETPRLTIRREIVITPEFRQDCVEAGVGEAVMKALDTPPDSLAR